MTIDWRELFMQTLREPAAAADTILSTPLSRGEIYTGLLAGSALNAAITGVSLQLFPLPSQWPAFVSQPLVYFVIIAAGMLLFAYLLTWAGRTVGGDGVVDDLLKLMVWMQIVRLALQAVGLVLAVLLPVLGGLYSLAVAVLSLWIVLNFIKAGHGLPSLWRAAVVLFITFVGLILVMSLFLALTGLGPLGVTADV